jgi:predicted ribosome quality control (RQC) complex YloA/Tae2 family protein
LQPVDYTTLMASCWELQTDWLPARLEQVYQRDRYTIVLGLRTLRQRGWLTLSWHPQAARVCIGESPPRTPDTFTFSQQLRHQLNGLALIAIDPIAAWERVLDLQFARRPGDTALWHLYVEIIGKYSNVILTHADRTIVTAAHQVSAQQSRVRPIQTGQPYEAPPLLLNSVPTQVESLVQWQARVRLIPGTIARNLLKNYRGLSTALVQSMLHTAGLDPEQTTDSLSDLNWQQLYQCWQTWLSALEHHQYQPAWTAQGYTVLGWAQIAPAPSVQELLNRYYTEQLDQQNFQHLHHQLRQILKTNLTKLRQKAVLFTERLQQSDQADRSKEQADLLMAYLQDWQPGMQAIVLPDFVTGQPMTIPLNPEKNAVQNAQAFYKQHQKLKRARTTVEPLLQQVQTEIDYLEQVETTLAQLERDQQPGDRVALQEIRDELVQQGYLTDPDYNRRAEDSRRVDSSLPYRYHSPSGFELWVGRNNRQNDQLTFRTAGDYDLWFHTQEIPGSHVLLRLSPGASLEEPDLQFAADLAAYFSRARHSDQVPVVYTEPRHVYKPKGAKPGMVVYQNERVCWGCPRQGELYIRATIQQSENVKPS